MWTPACVDRAVPEHGDFARKPVRVGGFHLVDVCRQGELFRSSFFRLISVAKVTFFSFFDCDEFDNSYFSLLINLFVYF